MMINDNERVDDLQRNGYKLIQNKECFCFGMDAVLLSTFAKAQENDKVLYGYGKWCYTYTYAGQKF